MATEARTALSTKTNAILGVSTLVPALMVAENFYKFHSFTVEFAAFAATWGGLYFLVRLMVRR